MTSVPVVPPKRILIDLGSRLLCEALQVFLETRGAVCQPVASHDLSQPQLRNFQPDIILVSIHALRRSPPPTVQWNEAKVILIDTGLAADEMTRLLFTHKVDGVISTDTGYDLFRKALQAVTDGQIWIDNCKLKALLCNPALAANPSEPETFSKKELVIVRLIAEGLRNREIATKLNISEQTVKTHVSRILQKANATSRTQLALLALTLNA
jgi:DNA-binding NarL/FixJ family response regulator